MLEDAARMFAALDKDVWYPGVVSFVVSVLLFYSSKLVSPLIFPGYSQCKARHRIDWDSRIASSLHAVLSTALSLWVLWNEKMLLDDTSELSIVVRMSPASQATLAVSMGYLLADLVLVLTHWFALGNAAILSHHIISVSSLIISLNTGKAHPYVMLMLITEITTPFINMRWYLNRLGRQDGQFYILNALVTIFLWVTVRCVMFLWYFHHLWVRWAVVQDELSVMQKVLVVLVPGVLFVLNMFWLYKIIIAALRFLTHQSPLLRSQTRRSEVMVVEKGSMQMMLSRACTVAGQGLEAPCAGMGPTCDLTLCLAKAFGNCKACWPLGSCWT